MSRRPSVRGPVSLLVFFALTLSAGFALAQWYPPQGQQSQQPQQPQYPQQPGYPQQPSYPSQPSYPPQPSYPAQPSYPPQQPGYPSGAPQPPMPSGQTYADALGRFRLSPPQGTVLVAAIYNFMNPAAMTQVAIQAMAHDQMFQTNLQQFPGMMRQMGGKVDTEQPMNVRGKPARLIAVTMRDQSGASTHSMNVFISEVNIWIQVMGPEQNTPQIAQTLQAILNGMQF